MPFPTITEAHGWMGRHYLPEGAAFARPATPTEVPPLGGDVTEEDPGWFAGIDLAAIQAEPTA